MPDEIIGMQAMAVIFSVTDVMGIHRESVRVELTKEDPGSIERTANGMIEITIPESGTVEEFSQRLQAELEAMGYEPQELDEDEDDE
ncbi:hypothetical protein IIA16_02650 [bacterium]|nr:hypothetical protein [bacterium]